MVTSRGKGELSVIFSHGGVDPCPFACLSSMPHEVRREERMNGPADVPDERQDVHGQEEDVVGVILACISCGRVEEIHVFRDRKLRGRVYWDCLDCQKNGNRFASFFKPVTQGRSRSCE